MSIGKRFYELRQALGLNQTDFGRPILLSQTTVGQMENETRTPTERTIVLTIDKWHCSETWLRTGEGAMFENVGDDFISELAAKYQLTAFQKNLARIVYEMPAAQQDVLLDIARQMLAESETVESDEERTVRIVRAARADADAAETDQNADKRA